MRAHRDGSAGDADYGTIGDGYHRYRQPEPAFAEAIARALGDARTVISVGAGAGSYEPVDLDVIAVELSASMRAQRPAHLVRAVGTAARARPTRPSPPTSGATRATETRGRVTSPRWSTGSRTRTARPTSAAARTASTSASWTLRPSTSAPTRAGSGRTTSRACRSSEVASRLNAVRAARTSPHPALPSGSEPTRHWGPATCGRSPLPARGRTRCRCRGAAVAATRRLHLPLSRGSWPEPRQDRASSLSRRLASSPSSLR